MTHCKFISGGVSHVERCWYRRFERQEHCHSTAPCRRNRAEAFQCRSFWQRALGAVSYVGSLDGETRVVMETTGNYHEPVLKAFLDAVIFVSAVNPTLIKHHDSDKNPLRKVKSDPAGARKIAKYTLDKWEHLRQHSAMDTIQTPPFPVAWMSDHRIRDSHDPPH